MKRLIYSVIFSVGCFGATAALAADAITTANVNMRSGPGTRYGVRTSVPAGYHVGVGNCTRNWCQVNFSGYGGWISARYLAFNQGGIANNYSGPTYSRTAVVPILIPLGGYWGGDYYRRRHHHYRGYRQHYYGRHHYRPYHHGGYYGGRPHYRPSYRPAYRPHYRGPVRFHTHPPRR